jgi:arylsulfatase A-like enzyme
MKCLRRWTRRRLSWLSVTAGLCLPHLVAGLGAAPANTRDRLPHIVFILADDLGIGDLGCYNRDSKIPTPNLDRLAQQGVRLTDAHTPSGVCTPTRYGLLTGRYAWRTRLKRGVLVGDSPNLIEPGRLTVARLLQRHGYATACVGKWHLGLGDTERTDYTQPLRPGPLDFGFDYFFGIPASLDMAPYVFVENDRATEPPTETIAASKSQREGGQGFWRGGGIAPGFKHEDVLPEITEKALAFIERQANAAAPRPFFLYFPLTGPHTPWMPIAEFRGKSQAGPYGDFVAQVDWTVGKIMKALDRLKLAERTLLIFTSDNGGHWLASDIEQFGHRSNLHYRGQKGDIFEGGHRVPFLARWPGRIKPGSTSDALMGLTDFMATAAAIVGATLPDNAAEDSFNAWPALLGQKAGAQARDSFIHHSSDGMFAIRQGKWKFVRGLGSGGFTPPKTLEPKPGEAGGQLYDLVEDPSEQKNRYLEQPEEAKRLSALLEKQIQEGRSRPSERSRQVE